MDKATFGTSTTVILKKWPIRHSLAPKVEELSFRDLDLSTAATTPTTQPLQHPALLNLEKKMATLWSTAPVIDIKQQDSPQ